MTEVGKGFSVDRATSAAFLEVTRNVPHTAREALAAIALHGLASGGKEYNVTDAAEAEGPITNPESIGETVVE